MKKKYGGSTAFGLLEECTNWMPRWLDAALQPKKGVGGKLDSDDARDGYDVYGDASIQLPRSDIRRVLIVRSVMPSQDRKVDAHPEDTRGGYDECQLEDGSGGMLPAAVVGDSRR